MRLLLYNIRYGTGTGWSYHFPFPFSGCFRRTTETFGKIAEYVTSLAPDVACLVETDGGSVRQGGESQPGLLALRLGGRSVFTCKYRRDSIVSRTPLLKSQGNAVVTSLPIVSSQGHNLSRGMKNMLLEVEFEKFTLFLMHLSLGSGARKAQIEEISRICENRQKPVILAGDGNAFTGPGEFDPVISRCGLVPAGGAAATYPSGFPLLPLDVVLCSPRLSVRRYSAPPVLLSDHRPIICDIDMEAGSPLNGGEAGK